MTEKELYKFLCGHGLHYSDQEEASVTLATLMDERDKLAFQVKNFALLREALKAALAD